MNPAYLEDDELQYELGIRNVVGLTDPNSKRRALRQKLREEANGDLVPPNSDNFDINEEFILCEGKFRQLTLTPVGERDKYKIIFNSRFLHLLFRLERLEKRVTDSDCKSKITEMIVQIKSMTYSNQENMSDQEFIEEGAHGLQQLNNTNGLPKQGQQLRTSIATSVPPTSSGVSRDKPLATMSGLTSQETTQLERALSVINLLSGKAKAATAANVNNVRSRLTTGIVRDGNDSSDSEYNNPFGDSLFEGPFRPTEIFGGEPVKNTFGRVKVAKWPIKFSGDGTGMSLNDFLAEIRILGINEDVSEAELLRNIYHLLLGSARIWYRANWQNYKKWSQFVAALRREFLPTDHDYWLAREIDSRMQGKNESFGVYVASMELLFQNFIEPVARDRQLKTIIRNMRPFYLEKLSLIEIRSLDELKSYCKRIDDVKYNLDRRFSQHPSNIETKNVGRHKLSALCKSGSATRNCDSDMDSDESCEGIVHELRYRKKKSCKSPPQTVAKPKIDDTPKANMEPINPVETLEKTTNEKKKFVIKCWNCYQEGHHFNFCRDRNKRIFCYRCGKEGAYSPSCPKCKPNPEN